MNPFEALFIRFIVGGLINAVFFRAGAKWVEKEDVSFGSAFTTMLLMALVYVLVSFAANVGVDPRTASPNFFPSETSPNLSWVSRWPHG